MDTASENPRSNIEEIVITDEQIVARFERVLRNDVESFMREGETVFQVTLTELLQFTRDLLSEAQAVGGGTPFAEAGVLQEFVANKVATAAARYWTSPIKQLPEFGTKAHCILRHHDTHAVQEHELSYVPQDDVAWRTVDGSDIDYSWEVIAWRK